MVVDDTLEYGDIGETPSSSGDPQTGTVITHHNLGVHTHQVAAVGGDIATSASTAAPSAATTTAATAAAHASTANKDRY